MRFDQQFYGAWAEKQLKDQHREIVLQWKAVHLANLYKRNLPNERVTSVCEIGGAEGIVLFTAGALLGARELVNIEPCSAFCEAGRKKYKDIRFLNTSYQGVHERSDVIILSDLLEHVEDEHDLLMSVSSRCRFALIKMPIERSLSLSGLGYFLRGRRKPPEMNFGLKHYNAHLRGYTVNSALATTGLHLKVLDWYALDHSFYYRGSARFTFFRKWVGLNPLLRIFGGSLFILARGQC